jgi:hypothetical protein
MSTQGQGDGGVYFSTLGPCSYELGKCEYEYNLIKDCYGIGRMADYEGQGRLSAVFVAACHPSILQPAPGGRDRAKVVTKSDFAAFSLPHVDGNYFLRPDRILGVFYIDPNNQPRSGSSNVSNPLIIREKEADLAGIDIIQKSLEKQTETFNEVMAISSTLLLSQNNESFRNGNYDDDVGENLSESEVYNVGGSGDGFSLNLNDQTISNSAASSEKELTAMMNGHPLEHQKRNSIELKKKASAVDISNARMNSQRNAGLASGRGWAALRNKVKEAQHQADNSETRRTSQENALVLAGGRRHRSSTESTSQFPGFDAKDFESSRLSAPSISTNAFHQYSTSTPVVPPAPSPPPPPSSSSSIDPQTTVSGSDNDDTFSML